MADTGGESILIGCMYRPKIIKNNKGETMSLGEHRRRDVEINDTIRFANNLIKKGVFQGLILAGDFNYGELNWNENLEPEILIEAEPSDCFLDCLNECFLSQNVFFKTFQQDSSRLTNQLDLVITESKERIYELRPGSVLGGQDHGHLCITWKYALKKASSVVVAEDRCRRTN